VVPPKEKKMFASPSPSKDIENYLSGFTKKFGAESAFVLGGQQELPSVEVIPTGIPPLDNALGVGGIPRGRMVEIYGPEATGKSTLAIQVAARAQSLGGIVHYIDAEHALDLQYAQRLGLDLSKGLVSQPDSGEQALEMADFAIEAGVDLIVVDSVAALVPKAEIEGEMGSAHMGLQARLMSQAMRKITSNLNKHRSSIIFINQLRQKIGVMFGNPETTTGGNALKFYASVRLDVRKSTTLKNGEEVIGHTMKVKVVKNKVAPPFREAEFDLIYGEGFDVVKCWLNYGVDTGVIEKTGAWYSFEGERIGQGADNARAFLVEHPEMLKKIQENIAIQKNNS
jgi:recombination protein RecA